MPEVIFFIYKTEAKTSKIANIIDLFSISGFEFLVNKYPNIQKKSDIADCLRRLSIFP